jgi:CheY-like chemotaxis protein
LNDTADESGSTPHPERERLSTSPSPKPLLAHTPQPLTLLLVEDNLPDALVVREAIKGAHLQLEVHAATDGEAAIAFVQRAAADPTAPCPHVLILDLNLPKIEGLEVLRKIRSMEKFKNMPVLIVTSSDAPADRSEAAKLGASYFRKPVSWSEFMMVGTRLRDLLMEKGLLC